MTRPSSNADTRASIWIRSLLSLWTIFGAAFLATSIWGRYFCHTLVHPSAGSDRALDSLGEAYCWFVFFGAFAVLGVYALWRSAKNLIRGLASLQSDETVQFISPSSTHGEQSVQTPISEQLDEATKQRLSQLGARAAKLTGASVGLGMIGIGLAGFVWAAMSASRLPGASIRYVGYFLVSCGIAIVLGSKVLHETFRKTDFQ